eukprot:jgi/Astpho2/3060/e_gw1.00051.213.1_t
MNEDAAALGCSKCGNLSFNKQWQEAFGVVFCNGCKASEELISKGTAKQTLLVTDSDLKKLGSITKPNPQHKDWAPMRLYLLSQVG